MNNDQNQNRAAPLGADADPAGRQFSGTAPGALPKKKEAQKPKLQSFMRQWFEQYCRLVTVAACAVLLAAGYAFLLAPKLARARSISGEQFLVVRHEREALELRLGYAAKLGAGSAAARGRTIKQVDDLLPSDPATPQILTSLETIAAESGAVIDGIELVVPDEKTRKDADSDVVLPAGVSYVEVTLAVGAGPYEALKTLLKNIEANIRLMDVIAVVYSPIGKSYTIILRAYYLSENI
ncbi:MAG: hypothetical protein HYW81_01450 [Parcubacteria group bacterium]|nr:hypothetical protein [Parcubacteria group bacterium]